MCVVVVVLVVWLVIVACRLLFVVGCLAWSFMLLVVVGRCCGWLMFVVRYWSWLVWEVAIDVCCVLSLRVGAGCHGVSLFFVVWFV